MKENVYRGDALVSLELYETNPLELRENIEKRLAVSIIEKLPRKTLNDLFNITSSYANKTEIKEAYRMGLITGHEYYRQLELVNNGQIEFTASIKLHERE